MTLSDDEKRRIRSYLLGELAQEDARQLDDRLLRDDSFAEQVGFVEDEIIEDYVRRDLSAGEAERLEKHFFTTPRRRRSLEIVRGLRERAIVVVHDGSHEGEEEHVGGVLTGPGVKSDALTARRGTWLGARWKVAAVIAFVLLAGAGAWYAVFHQSPEARGLAALDKAYRRQRPLEARVVGLTYAPFVAKRGTDPEEVDYRARDYSRSLLLDAAENNPTASTLNALGRFYLTQQEFNKAIDQFEKGLRLAPDEAQINSDMGVALMELGNAESPRGQGPAMEYFARGLKHLNRALELDDSLLEARYNRALIYQHMMLPQQARAEWESYLQRDAVSPWADEARRNLKIITEQGQQTSQKREQMFEEFVTAYGTDDAALAWRVLSRSRSKTGNFIVERLLDEYLTLAGRSEQDDAAARLRMLQYAGRVEEQAVGDRFTADLANFYAHATEEQKALAARGRALARSAQEQYNRGELERAASRYREAASLFGRASNEGEAMFAEGWAGYCYVRIPDTGRATQVFERLSRAYEERNYRSLLAQSLHALSDIQTSLDEVSKALDYAQRSLKVSEQIQDTANQLRCLQQFVSMHLKLGSYRESLGMGRHALRLAQGLPDDPKLIWPFYHEIAFDFYHLGITVGRAHLNSL
jgi:tetratricopeptide (TPR) repeat protein